MRKLALAGVLLLCTAQSTPGPPVAVTPPISLSGGLTGMATTAVNAVNPTAIGALLSSGTVPTPVAGTTMAVNNLFENGSLLLKNEGGLWSGQTYAWLGISKTMTATTVPTPGANGPLSSLFVYAAENGSGAPVVSILGDCNVVTTGGYCSASNLIARTNGGAISAKLVGLEIDIEPAVGDTVAAGSAGLYLNAFNSTSAGAAIQTGSMASGKFSNGLVLDGIATTGAGISTNSGAATMAYLLYTGNSSFGTAAIQIGNDTGSNRQRIRFAGTSGDPAQIYVDSSNFTHIVPADNTLLIRDPTDAVNIALFDTSGVFYLPFIGSDATHTDASVCEDTTSHAFLSGSGAAGICLGTSSLRFKTNVAALQPGLAEVMALEPISYRYKPGIGLDSNRELYGFAAEQVNEVMPKLVGLDTDGRPNSVDWAGVVPVLVRAIQEQQREIEALKAR